mmetsp:Transcript_31331/g.61523  ORF Transcript_31331/g.61523 Transcript_31331/m.61523 type:complete len:263 (+) Transcript_31331:157-945(+)
MMAFKLYAFALLLPQSVAAECAGPCYAETKVEPSLGASSLLIVNTARTKRKADLLEEGSSSSKTTSIAHKSQKPVEIHPNDDAGGDISLDVDKDQLVKDCKKLIERTAADICKKAMTLKVFSATKQVIDGVEVNMEVEVTGPSGSKARHSPSCLFETSSDHIDASLFQHHADPAEQDPTEAEKDGLVGTVRMQTDICKADEVEGKDTKSLLEQNLGFIELTQSGGGRKYAGSDQQQSYSSYAQAVVHMLVEGAAGWGFISKW